MPSAMVCLLFIVVQARLGVIKMDASAGYLARRDRSSRFPCPRVRIRVLRSFVCPSNGGVRRVGIRILHAVKKTQGRL